MAKKSNGGVQVEFVAVGKALAIRLPAEYTLPEQVKDEIAVRCAYKPYKDLRYTVMPFPEVSRKQTYQNPEHKGFVVFILGPASVFTEERKRIVMEVISAGGLTAFEAKAKTEKPADAFTVGGEVKTSTSTKAPNKKVFVSV